jgi:CRISPR system Cascade subunit CasC
MHLELHLLQHFSLSNLNRDDTGAPKGVKVGGFNRARISSQCQKRAIREYFTEAHLLPASQLAVRTKKLTRAIVERLAGRLDAEAATSLAEKALAQVGFTVKKGKTDYLVFIGQQELDRIAALCLEYQEALMGEAKQAKKDGPDLAKLFLGALSPGAAVDVALFGRMIADAPGKNVDAAVQMAHAQSTHAVATEFDFYSAVDDLQESADEEGAGAAMLGTVPYNASCYYRYMNLDLAQLAVNLDGDLTTSREAVSAFIRAAVEAVPSGKQTNSAAQNPPSLVLAVLRDGQRWSLANAFVNPVRPGAEHGLIQVSADALCRHWGELAKMYGTAGVQYAGVATYLQTPAGLFTQAQSVADLTDQVMGAIRFPEN